MDSALSMKYARTVQQLQKKKDELEQVFDEARKLEADNEVLLAENRELKSQNYQLESTAKALRADVATLEAQVLKQQAKLQTFIDKELSAVQTKKGNSPNRSPATTTGPSNTASKSTSVAHMSADLSECRRQIATLEDAWRTALEAAEKYRKGSEMLYNEVVSLRNEAGTAEKEATKLRDEIKSLKKSEGSLKDAVKKLHARNVDVAKEADEMDRIEAKALEGLRAELLVLASENHRLTATIGEERRLHREARNEFEKYESLVRKQRSLNDGQTRIATEEVRNLSSQNDMLLDDIKRLTLERDQLKKLLAESQQRASQTQQLNSPTPKAAKTPSKGPTEVDSIAATLQHAKHVREQMLKSATTAERSTNTTDVYSSPNRSGSPTRVHYEVQNQKLQNTVQELLQQNDSLHTELRSMQRLLQEKESTDGLRAEKQALLQSELAQARTALGEALRSKEWFEKQALRTTVPQPQTSSSASSEERLFIDKIREIVGSTLVTASLAFKQFQEQAAVRHRSVSVSSNSSAGDDSDRDNRRGASSADVVPIVPCHKFSDPLLNSIYEQIGGIRHILRRFKKLTSVLETHARAPSGVSNERGGALHSETPFANRAGTERTAAAASSQFDLNAWLQEREMKAQEASFHHSPARQTTPAGLRLPPSYLSGESLLDAVEELRRTPSRTVQQRGSAKRMF
jgi:hypothetical protein